MLDRLTALGTRLGFEGMGCALGRRLSVLTFHRVLAQPDRLRYGEPDVQQFDRMMRLISASFVVLQMRQAIELIKQNDLPRRALVISFDDGYADNAKLALPVLLRHGLVATFYVSTGFLNGGRMWNDSVIESIRGCTSERLDLGFLGLEEMHLPDDDARRSVIAVLLHRIKYLKLQERDAAVERLRIACGSPQLPSDLMMNPEQVRQLALAGMEVGGHTVSHPILTSLSRPEAEDEIRSGKQALEAMIQSSVSTFAYPNGKPDKDYDNSHVDIVKSLGFSGAVSTAKGVAAYGDDLFQLPRISPWGATVAVWAFRLMQYYRRRDFSLAQKSGN